MAHLMMQCMLLKKKKLLDSLLGDRRWWCLGFLGAVVDQVLGGLGIYIDKTVNHQAASHAPQYPSMLRTAFGQKSHMWSQGDV
jgi:hypothetical protein